MNPEINQIYTNLIPQTSSCSHSFYVCDEYFGSTSDQSEFGPPLASSKPSDTSIDALWYYRHRSTPRIYYISVRCLLRRSRDLRGVRVSPPFNDPPCQIDRDGLAILRLAPPCHNIIMDEKVVDGESVMVKVQAIKSTPDVGAAIEAMEARLSQSGIILAIPPTTVARKDVVARKLINLQFLVHIGIIHAIDSGTATEKSIGEITSKKALVPGNIVALYSYNSHPGKFLRIYDKKADYGGGCKSIDNLPIIWGSERFLVVDAGNGSISFYNPCHRTFLGSFDGKLTANGFPIVSIDDRPRANESFQIHGQNHSGIVGICCGIDSKDKIHHFHIVQVKGFSPIENND